MDLVEDLSKKIAQKKATVGIIGMGYVGSALAELVIKNGFTTIGFVTRQERADAINKQNKKLLTATTDISLLHLCDIIIICVQTPIDEQKLPDLTHLIKATKQVAQYMKKSQLIIIESSIATGTTRRVVLPILDETNLKAGEEFFLSFSPERVDPGNKQFDLEDIPKVVSGLESNSKQLAVLFYQQIIKRVVPVSSLETAEMVKLFENTFRLINISLVNELAAYTKTWDIDMWEIVNAAATKPFGFLPHYPSPGIGGHCIPVDPFYLYDDAKKRGITLSMIENAGKINDEQPHKVVSRAIEILDRIHPVKHGNGKAFSSSTKGAALLSNNNYRMLSLAGEKGGESHTNEKSKGVYKVLLIGIAYKPDIDDMRESPSLRIWKILERAGCSVSYHDPYIPFLKTASSLPLTAETLKSHDMIIIVTNHSTINYEKLASFGKPILDTRHVLAQTKQPHIYAL